MHQKKNGKLPSGNLLHAHQETSSLKKQKRRRLERRWRKTKLLVDENAFKRQKNRVNALLNAFSIKYNSDLVKKNAKKKNSLFRIIN